MGPSITLNLMRLLGVFPYSERNGSLHLCVPLLIWSLTTSAVVIVATNVLVYGSIEKLNGTVSAAVLMIWNLTYGYSYMAIHLSLFFKSKQLAKILNDLCNNNVSTGFSLFNGWKDYLPYLMIFAICMKMAAFISELISVYLFGSGILYDSMHSIFTTMTNLIGFVHITIFCLLIRLNTNMLSLGFPTMIEGNTDKDLNVIENGNSINLETALKTIEVPVGKNNQETNIENSEIFNDNRLEIIFHKKSNKSYPDTQTNKMRILNEESQLISSQKYLLDLYDTIKDIMGYLSCPLIFHTFLSLFSITFAIYFFIVNIQCIGKSTSFDKYLVSAINYITYGLIECCNYLIIINVPQEFQTKVWHI